MAALLALLVRPGAVRIGGSTTTSDGKEQRALAVAPRREAVAS
jgi:hypothetical protein